MSLIQAEVDIANKALGRIHGKQITLAVQTSLEGVQANLWYEHTRDTLLRSYDWPFARARASLTESTSSPAFEWDNQFPLPDDYLRMRSNYSIDDTNKTDDRYVIEGDMLLTNESEAQIRYVRKVTDPTEFDPLFTEILILKLAIQMLFPIAGTSSLTLNMHVQLNQELTILTDKAVCIAYNESNVTGRKTHLQARLTD